MGKEGDKGLASARRIYEERQRRIADYELITELHESRGWPVAKLCEILEISRGAYYKWLNRKPTELEEENEKILEEIKDLVKEHKGLFGYRKMTMELNKRLEKRVNYKRIYRLMCINGIQSMYRKKKYKYRKSEPQQTAENTLGRDFNAKRPGEKWGTDITEIRVPGTDTKLYISTIFDMYGNYPLAVKVSRHNDVPLVEATLEEAIRLFPGAKPIFHSDRGFQYTRKPFQNKLISLGMTPSMSRVTRCVDNGMVEGFQGIIKDILAVRHPNIRTVEGMEAAIYETYDYYRTRYPMIRYGGKTASEVFLEGLLSEVPKQYPIKTSPSIKKYWKRINEKKMPTETVGNRDQA